MSTVQPFPFESLKKFTAREASLINHLATCFPEKDLQSELLGRLLTSLNRYLQETNLSARYESVFEATFGQFVSGLPERFVCFVVSLTPLPKKVIIEVDFDLSFALVDKLLGGPGEIPRIARPLTALEEGILQFLVVKILREMSDYMKGGRYHLRFDKITTQTGPLSLLEDQETKMVLITFRVQLNGMDGYVRVCIGHPLLSELQSNSTPLFDPALMKHPSFLQGRLRNFDYFRTLLWVEAGHVTLSAAEVGQLEPGDIILFDESFPSFENKRLSGNIRLRIGDGLQGGFDGILEGDIGDKIKVKIDSVFNE